MNLRGKRIVIFGGTSGIGKAATKLFSIAGAKKIYAISRSPEKYKNVSKNTVLKKVDVLDEANLKKTFNEIGKFDVLVNTATGGDRAIGPFNKMKIEGYRNSFRKLWGYVNTVKYGLKDISKEGNIILVSGSPARKCKPGQIALASVGGAVEAFARSLASEIKPIRINVVSPGVIDTPMSLLKGKERKKFYKNITKDNLIQRAGTSDEVARAIIFAAENEFITGTTIDIDGGWISS